MLKNCKGLTELIIPEGIIKIGISAFSQSSVTKVTIAESVKYIGLYAFGKLFSINNSFAT